MVLVSSLFSVVSLPLGFRCMILCPYFESPCVAGVRFQMGLDVKSIRLTPMDSTGASVLPSDRPGISGAH